MGLYNKPKKNQNAKGKRFLISITVLGSAGPIRFVANEEDIVASVMDRALKLYSRQGRLPVLGSDINNCLLYCPTVESEAISPWSMIGSVGARSFMLCKKPESEKVADNNGRSITSKKGAGSWKSWLHKSLSLIRIPSH